VELRFFLLARVRLLSTAGFAFPAELTKVGGIGYRIVLSICRVRQRHLGEILDLSHLLRGGDASGRELRDDGEDALAPG
jgi:hypothetical protein